MSSCGTGGQFVISVQCLLKSQGFDCDSLFLLKKVFGTLAANLGSGSTDAVCLALQLFFARLLRERHSHCRVSGGQFLVWSFLRRWFGVVLLGGSEMEGDRPPPLRRYPSVLDMGNMVAVEYEGETRLFPHRLMLRKASTAAVLNTTTGRMCNFSERPLLDSHSRWRQVPRGPPSPASDRYNTAQREERTYPDDDDACWSPLGAGLRIRSSQAHIALFRSHRAGGSRSSRDGGHLQGG